MRKSTNLENPINQYSTLNQLLQPHLGVLPNAFGIAFKPTAAINVHGAFPKIDHWISKSHIRERTLQRWLLNPTYEAMRSAC